MSLAINRIFSEARDRSGPLDDLERQAAITICDRALADRHTRPAQRADAKILLEMCGLLRREAKP